MKNNRSVTQQEYQLPRGQYPSPGRTLPHWNEQRNSMYRDHLNLSNSISKILFLLSEHRSQLLGLQHDPANPNLKLHEHGLGVRIDATLQNRESINRELGQLEKAEFAEHERALLRKFAETRQRFSLEGVFPARDLLQEGKFGEARA